MGTERSIPQQTSSLANQQQQSIASASRVRVTPTNWSQAATLIPRDSSNCNPAQAALSEPQTTEIRDSAVNSEVPRAGSGVQTIEIKEQAVNSQVPQAGVQIIGNQEPAADFQEFEAYQEQSIWCSYFPSLDVELLLPVAGPTCSTLLTSSTRSSLPAVDFQEFEAYQEQSIWCSYFPPLDGELLLPVADPTCSTLLTSSTRSPLPAALAPTARPNSRPPNPLPVSACKCFRPRAKDAQPFNIALVCTPGPLTDNDTMQWSVELSFFAGRRKEKGGKTGQVEARAWLMELSHAISVNRWKTWHCFQAVELMFTEYARTWYCQLNAATVPVPPLREHPHGWSLFLTQFVMHFVTPSEETRRMRYSELQQLPNETLLDYATALYGEALELGDIDKVHDSSSFLSGFLRGMTDKSRVQVFKHIFGVGCLRGLDTNVAAVRTSRLLTDLHELLLQQDEQHRIQSNEEPEVMSRLKPKYRCMMDCMEAICRKVEASSGCSVDDEPPLSVEEFLADEALDCEER